MPAATKKKSSLVEEIGAFFLDPLGFVRYAYPWGEEGTILAEETGPDEWQTKLLRDLGAQLRENAGRGTGEAIRKAIASGHGIGKSALVAWLIQWFMSTRSHSQAVVTANTETQLNTKTWREMAKWHKLLINRRWFEWTATQFKHVDHPETWFASAIAWSDQRPEAFAGTHDRDVLMLFDEASAIPDIIWETAEGAMTTPGAMWFVFGNMTRAVGKFVDCFERFRHRWDGAHIDSRTAKKANQKQIAEWQADYGEDSDFFRIRVRGVKPRSGSKQYISHETVYNCHQYKAVGYERFPKLMGVDLARKGDCESVICVRQSRKVYPLLPYREPDGMQMVAYVGEALQTWRPQLCFIEGVGLGGPMIDRLRQLGWSDVIIEVNPGGKLKGTEDWANNRTRWWAYLKAAMEDGLELPDDVELDKQLVMVEYGHNKITTQLQLQSKEEMAYSPDRADALALTYCQGNIVVASRDIRPLDLPFMDCA